VPYGTVLGAGRLEILDAGQQLVGVAFRTGLGFQALCRQALVAAARQDGGGNLCRAESQHEQAEGRADDQQQDQVRGGHPPVQERGQGPRGQDLPDG
jgi:hypothetical protein